MHGTCTDCNRITDTGEYPYFFSICAECWERFRNAADTQVMEYPCAEIPDRLPRQKSRTSGLVRKQKTFSREAHR